MSSSNRIPDAARWAPGPELAHDRERLLVASSPASSFVRWQGSFRVEPQASKRTPIVERLTVEVSAEGVKRALPHGSTCWLSFRDCLVGTRSHDCFQLFACEPSSDAALRFTWREVLRFHTDGATHRVYPRDLCIAWQRATGFRTMERDGTPSFWVPDGPELFSHFLDIGWNLPVWRNAGGTTLVRPMAVPIKDEPTDEDPFLDGWRMVWQSASDVHAHHSTTHPTANARERAWVDAYEAGRVPFHTAFASALTLTTPPMDECLLRVASAARQRGDARALQALASGIARLIDTRTASFTLLNAYWFCFPPDGNDATRIIDDITQMILHTYAQKDIGQQIHDCARTFIEPIPTTQKPRNAPPANVYFKAAYKAFTDEDDTQAWQAIAQAIAAGEIIYAADIAQMLLRLIPKHPQDGMILAILQAILRDDPDEASTVRAAQQLAEAHDALGAFDQANTVLTNTLSRYPDNLLAQIAHAQFLSRQGADEAIHAWERVLQHPELEAWEALQFQDELQALRKQASSMAPRLSENNKRERLLELLTSLFPSNFPSDTPPEAALASLQRLLSDAVDLASRAQILAQRAVYLLQQHKEEQAAQAWTGAMICAPDTVEILAGLAVTHVLQGATQQAKGSQQAFLNALANTPAPNATLRALRDAFS